MNKLNYLFILFFACTIFSCEKETLNIPPKEDDKEIDDPVLERIRAMGFDMNTVVDFSDEYYLVDGDIMIPKKITDENTLNQRHINFSYEFHQKRPIRIYLDNDFNSASLYNKLSRALDITIAAYNNVQGARLTLERSYDILGNDIFMQELFVVEGSNSTAFFYPDHADNWECGTVGFAVTFSEIEVKDFSVSKLTCLMAHNIGHCIGRLDTDITPLQSYLDEGFKSVYNIPGSPSNDQASVMNGFYDNNEWNGFSHWDVVALRRLFPAIAKSDISLMYVNNKTDQIGYLFGRERYQYNNAINYGNMLNFNADWDFCKKSSQVQILYGIHKKNTASGKTEIAIIGTFPFSQSIVVTPLHQTNDNWTFTVGDYNQDGKDDIICINRNNTAKNKTTIHILNGATNFTSWIIHSITPLGVTNSNWDFTSGDVNNDGIIDIICINKQNLNANKTTIHVLNGATNYTSWLSHAVTPLGRTGSNFEFCGGDYNNDGRADVYAIKKWNTGTHSTEVHILNGANNFRNFLVQTGTSLLETSDDVEFCN